MPNAKSNRFILLRQMIEGKTCLVDRMNRENRSPIVKYTVTRHEVWETLKRCILHTE